MNKKVSTAIIAVVCFLLTATVAVGYMIKEGIVDTSNLFANSDKADASDNISNSNSKELPGNAYLKEGAECTLDLGENEKSQHRYIYYKFNSMKISKQVEDFDICDPWDETMDKDGSITNDYSYIICNVTLQNKSDIDYDISLNSLWLYYGLDCDYTEARTYNSGRTNTLTKDYYENIFKPNEKRTYNIVYIEQDDIIEKYMSDMLLYGGFVEPDPNPNVTIPVIEKK